jgi:S-adenosylmethionine:tRNA ribosyltransferase-isomerase
MTRRSDYHYELPEHLIAQQPAKRRDQSRLLLLDGASGRTEHRLFADLPDLLAPGDCLVVNNSRVLPARLLGVRSDSGAPVEVLLLRRLNQTDWSAIVRPGRRVRTGHDLVFIPECLSAKVLAVRPDGNREIRFAYAGVWEEVLAAAGTMPLPPYIHERLADPERYQTVYAKAEGSVAAPTAGLHFTPELLERLHSRGIAIAELTLHVGLGTFRPVKSEDIRDHVMHAEVYDLPEAAVRTIQACRSAGGRIIAVGTTACRVLETVAAEHGQLRPQSGESDLFIYPGYTFRVIDRLLTNFHLPESTLIMLVAAFAGREHVLAAYREAVALQYRFFSFGDACLISPARQDGRT